MAKYTIEMGGWENNIQAKNADKDQVDLAQDLDDVWEIEEELFGGGGECEYECSAISFNDGLWFRILDEDQNELESWEYKDGMETLEDTLVDMGKDGDTGYESVCVDPDYADEYENTILLIHEYKRSCIDFVVESDTPVTKDDITTVTLCVEAHGDFDLINKIGFRGEIVEPDDFHGGDGKASYVWICQPGEEIIEIE